MAFTSEEARKPRNTAPGNAFQERRIKAGVTQKQLADMLDVSVSQLQRWENGTSKVTKVISLALDAVLGPEE